MANAKLTSKTQITTPADGDWLHTVDVSDTTDGSTGTSKKITRSDFLGALDDITASAAEINVLDGIPATLTSTELGYVDGVTSAIQTQLAAKATLASPTFTGTVVIPTPFTIAAVSMTATGTELNYLAGVTAGTSLASKALVADSGNDFYLAGDLSSVNFSTFAATVESLSALAADTPIQITNGTYQVPATYTPVGAATATLDVSNSNIHSITMPAGNITIAVSNETVGQVFLVEITQDGGGSRTVTWFSTIRWAGGAAPTLTTTGSKRDTFGFRVTGTDTYDGYIIGQEI